MSKIALLNDVFRKTLSGGKVMLTAGVNELPDMVRAAAIQKVVSFEDFNEDNDPYGEHDFGTFRLCGRRFFWKIDLYEEPGVKSPTGRVIVTTAEILKRAILGHPCAAASSISRSPRRQKPAIRSSAPTHV